MKAKHLIGIAVLASALLFSCKPNHEDSFVLTVRSFFEAWLPYTDTVVPSMSDIFLYRNNTYIQLDTSIVTVPGETHWDYTTYHHHAPEESLIASSLRDTAHHLIIPKGKHILIVRYVLFPSIENIEIYSYFFKRIEISRDLVILDTSGVRGRTSGYEDLY